MLPFSGFNVFTQQKYSSRTGKIKSWRYSFRSFLFKVAHFYWQRKLRTRIAESASPQLVPLEPPALPEEQLYIQYRGAELTLPDRVDMDAVAAILRSLQSL